MQRLECGNVSKRGGRAIADALTSNNVVTSLSLWGKACVRFKMRIITRASAHIKVAGVEAVGAMLRRNTTLRSLSLYGVHSEALLSGDAHSVLRRGSGSRE